MSDLMQEGAEWFASVLQSDLSQSVTYKRGSDTVVLLATIGETDREAYDAEGFTVKSKIRDWIVQPSDLVLDAVEITPRRGDQVIHVVGSKTFTWEVLDIGGDKHYRPSDPYGNLIRIHSQLSSVVDS